MTASKNKMITAIFRDRIDATEAYEWLRNRGYTGDELSVLMSDQTRLYYHHEHSEKIKSKTLVTAGVAAGGAIGTAIGAGLAAIATAIGTNLIMPGVGLVVAGPMAAAFAGGGAGAIAGGIIGGLVGYGIPESNARAYEEALKNGGVAIGVVPRNDHEQSVIEARFNDLNGENIVKI